MWSIAGATPSPVAAADQAAFSLANTMIWESGTRYFVKSEPTSDLGSVPVGSTNHLIAARPPPLTRRSGWATSVRRYLISASASSPGRRGPIATSAKRSSTRAAISSVVATPRLTSIPPARAVNACSSAGTIDCANVLVVTTRNSSAAPLDWRTATSASTARLTICDAIDTTRRPAGVSSMPVPLRVINGSSRCWRSAASACDTAGSLTPRAAAAARTDPSRETSTNTLSCARVTVREL